MNKPNIFEYATSELSQDAFLCWLADWANPKYTNVNPAMRECAISFLNECFLQHGFNFPTSITDIQVKRQFERIDVAIIINQRTAILIEDKTYTKQHSNQLASYTETLQAKGYTTILPIYYKIIEQSDTKEISEAGYKIIGRTVMLSILKQAIEKGASESILVDYCEHLTNIDQSIQSYLCKKMWDDRSWIGFFDFLTQSLQNAQWDYVPNPSGGFIGLWWGFFDVIDVQLYLQLEQEKLCFKIYVPNKDKQNQYRELWKDKILNHAVKLNCSVSKPRKSGVGVSMTAAIWNGDYRVWKNDKLDIDGTLKNLKAAEQLLKNVVNAHHIS